MRTVLDQTENASDEREQEHLALLYSVASAAHLLVEFGELGEHAGLRRPELVTNLRGALDRLRAFLKGRTDA